MHTLEQLCHDMQTIHSETKSWQKVGEIYGINKALARLIANGYQPGNKVRAILGLPACHSFVVINGGNIPSDAQVIGIFLFCPVCGMPFIPNHPGRKKCFICSPFRKRSK